MELMIQSKICMLSHRKNQSGVVLIVALVFLIALTAVAAALMQNTTTDIKMSGASQEKAIAIQATISEMDIIIWNVLSDGYMNAGGTLSNILAQDMNAFGVPYVFPVQQAATTDAFMVGANQFNLETNCPAAIKGSDTEAFKCHLFRVTVNRTYGRNNNSRIMIHTGLAQSVNGSN